MISSLYKRLEIYAHVHEYPATRQTPVTTWWRMTARRGDKSYNNPTILKVAHKAQVNFAYLGTRKYLVSPLIC